LCFVVPMYLLEAGCGDEDGHIGVSEDMGTIGTIQRLQKM